MSVACASFTNSLSRSGFVNQALSTGAVNTGSLLARFTLVGIMFSRTFGTINVCLVDGSSN